MKSLIITGRRWFNKRKGNTYFSAQAFIDGNLAATIDYAYGYGNHYETEMFDKLERLGILPAPVEHYSNGSIEAPFRYCERNGITYSATATDVTRKKDL